MMYLPKCPDHRLLVSDLALGRLDDSNAMRAEHALDSCELCKTWWSETFECVDIKIVDDAVKDVFTSVELSPRRTRTRASVQKWMVAAAAALVIGIAVLWQTAPGSDIQQATAAAEDGIMKMDFESGNIASPLDSSLVVATAAQMDSVSAFARATTSSAQSATSAEKQLGTIDFESGDLAGLTPHT